MTAHRADLSAGCRAVMHHDMVHRDMTRKSSTVAER
jgi:hypothetical protein